MVARDAGLSPHVRGNPGPGYPYGWRRGSIPARAGEPYAKQGGGIFDGVYPRTCGGTEPVAGTVSAAGGLSPHVRGNQTR